MIRRPIRRLACCFALCGVVRAGAATYYVSQSHPSADDATPGTEDRPWATIGRAAAAAGPGDTVWIGAGVYREAVRLDRGGTADRPIRFEAAPAGTVVLTGADRVTGWKRDDAAGPPVYVAGWPHSFINFSPHHAHPDDDFHRLIGRAEQLSVQGYALRQVLEKSELSRGTFYVDLQAKRLYARNADDRDLSKPDVLVEASARDVALDCGGEYVTIRGLRLRYAANRAQQGAAIFRGAHDTIEDCVFERTNGVGASFLGPDQVARRCTFRDNGQMGFGAARAHRLLLSGCRVTGNNTKGFDRGWEAGGDKLVLCRGAVLDHCVIEGNRGSGVWFDIGNEDCEVRNCLIADNEDAGIFQEISFGLRAHDDVIVGNGLAGTPGAWGAAAGVCLSSSPGCVVERNLIVGNKEGFDFREQHRTTPRIDRPPAGGEEPVWNHDETVRNNVLAYNRDAQVWGWFDVPDQRPWPRSMWESSAAGELFGPPPGTDLAGLRLVFAGNLYAVAPGQGLFNWGASWRRHVSYTSLEDVRRELGLEPTGGVGRPGFHDCLTRDFRVPRDSPAARLKCYPQGTVPGVTLGIDE